MRSFVVQLLLSLILTLASSSWAKNKDNCAWKLSGVRISTEVEGELESLHLSKAVFDKLVTEALDRFFDGEPLLDKIVIFTENKIDEGFVVELVTDKQGDYWVNDVRKARQNDEREFFHSVARLEGVRGQSIRFNDPVLGRKSMNVAPNVAVKLELKHNVSLKDVEYAINHRTSQAELAEPRDDDGPDPRYFFYGISPDRKRIKITLAQAKSGSLFLVTAYEER